MARTTATQEQILESIVERLIDQIDVAHPDTCFFSDEPYPRTIPQFEIFFTVSVGDGIFDENFFASAGENTLCEQSDVRVSMFVAIQEMIDRNEQSLLSAQRGLITVYKPKILKAILKDAWEPTYGGNQLLRNMIRPIRWTAPQEFGGDEAPRHVGASLTFATDFDWAI